jgi:hypothetical protein
LEDDGASQWISEEVLGCEMLGLRVDVEDAASVYKEVDSADVLPVISGRLQVKIKGALEARRFKVAGENISAGSGMEKREWAG